MNTTTEKQEALFEYLLRLGDTSLILGHRLAGMVRTCSNSGRGYCIDEYITRSYRSGQNYYSLMPEIVEGKGRSEDALAYHRDAKQFRNLLIVEQPTAISEKLWSDSF